MDENLIPETVPQPRKAWLRNQQACGAKTKNGTGSCRHVAMANGKCRLHGGMTPRGIASANWKHGRYSKFIPARLTERYQAAVADPELLSQREAIAVLETRLGELLERWDAAGPDIDAERALWRDVRVVLEQRRKLIDSERERLVALRQHITVEQAMALVTALIASVRQHVQDRGALAAIQDDFSRLTHRPDVF